MKKFRMQTACAIALSGLLVALLLHSIPSNAADKALIVGIGNYQMTGADLPGISLDINAAKRAASLMGFEDRNIKILRDREATLSALEFAFERELVHGVTESDRVFFYFSGHGSQVPDESGDEPDGVDEVLLVYDSRKRYSKGETRLERVFTDDRFDKLIADIPTEDTLIVIDACHSGTVTRDILAEFAESSMQLVPKAFFYDSMPEPDSEDFIERGSVGSQNRYVGVSAAGDDQLAIATPEGSVFTNVLIDIIERAAAANRDLSLRQLVELSAAEVARRVPADRRFEPQLSGNADRAGEYMIVSK